MFDSLQTFWRLTATKYWGIEHKQHTSDNTDNYGVTKIFQDPHLINELCEDALGSTLGSTPLLATLMNSSMRE